MTDLMWLNAWLRTARSKYTCLVAQSLLRAALEGGGEAHYNVTHLAAQLRLTRVTVRARIKELEELGVLSHVAQRDHVVRIASDVMVNALIHRAIDAAVLRLTRTAPEASNEAPAPITEELAA